MGALNMGRYLSAKHYTAQSARYCLLIPDKGSSQKPQSRVQCFEKSAERNTQMISKQPLYLCM